MTRASSTAWYRWARRPRSPPSCWAHPSSGPGSSAQPGPGGRARPGPRSRDARSPWTISSRGASSRSTAASAAPRSGSRCSSGSASSATPTTGARSTCRTRPASSGWPAARGIRVEAVWVWIERDRPGQLSESNERLLAALKEAGLATQLWVGFAPGFFEGMSDEEKVARGRRDGPPPERSSRGDEEPGRPLQPRRLVRRAREPGPDHPGAARARDRHRLQLPPRPRAHRPVRRAGEGDPALPVGREPERDAARGPEDPALRHGHRTSDGCCRRSSTPASPARSASSATWTTPTSRRSCAATCGDWASRRGDPRAQGRGSSPARQAAPRRRSA